MAKYTCEPSKPHSSKSVEGKEHVDYHHFKTHDNGHKQHVGRCEGEESQHITEPSFVDSVKDFFGL